MTYLNGDVFEIQCNPEELLTVLGTKMSGGLYEKFFWYKMPFEDGKDRKTLCGGGTNFTKMCEAARWTGFVDVYVVDTKEHPTDDLENTEPCEAELRVEKNAAAFGDEEESFDYHDTPPNSDGEEEDDRVSYGRYKKGSGELKLGLGFDSLPEFKEAVIDYVLKTGWNIKMSKTGKKKNSALCVLGGCAWRIYCSWDIPAKKWMVKTFNDEHSCQADGYSTIIKDVVIAKLFMDDIMTDPDFSSKTMQTQIQKTYNIIVTYDQCKNAKSKALKIIKEEHELQFSMLRNYQTELLRSNPGSTVQLDTFTEMDGTETFQRFYVCFEVLKRTWKQWCRPIFGIDGCFLKSTLKGQLLAAVGRDANNGMYPIAWAVVDVENEDNWDWFLRKLKTDLRLGDGTGYTIISDRQKGLLNAVEAQLPRVEHRMCARHIYGNLKKQFPNQNDLKKTFWRVAESYTLQEYEVNVDLVKSYDINVYEAMMLKNPKNCSLAFFKESACCIDVHNNISESYNNAIDPSRYIPMVEMLETVRRGTMIRIDLRLKQAQKHQGMFSKRVAEYMAEEHKRLKFCKMIPGSDGRYEVRECNRSHSVNMNMKTCVCRKWDMSGIPYRHALRVIAEKKLNVDDYISFWYSTSRWELIYKDSIRPVNTHFFWKKDGSVVKPPTSLVEEIENRRGRKPKPKRKKPRHESPTKKKKLPRIGRVMHCKNCKEAGHNILKCPKIAAADRPKRKSKKVVGTQDGGTQEAGPSQSMSQNPTQSEG